MSIDISALQKRMEGTLSALKHDLSGLRTGRASAALLDPVMVDAYGQKTPLNQVSNINAPEPRLITVQIWDKSMVGPVEKAVRNAGLGLNPIVDGQNLRIPLPELNEERRRELVKVGHEYAEKAKIAIRHVRRDGMEEIKKSEKDSDIGEDESHSLSEKVQKMTDDHVTLVEKTVSDKEIEIMKV